MTRTAALAVVLVAAAVLAASAAATPPPQMFHFGVSHARPVAGHTFTGVTVTPGAGTLERWSVTCAATVHGATVPSRQHRYYDSLGRITAVSCSWKVPATPRGPLRADVLVLTDDGGSTGASASWRVRR